MKYEPTKYEWEVLEAIAEHRKLEWGAWVGACIDFLQEAGYLAPGGTRITERGREALEERKKKLEAAE